MRTKYIFAITILFIIFAIFIAGKNIAQATAGGNPQYENQIYGYSWSSNLGWISFNNCSSPVGIDCTGFDYGVSINSTEISGYHNLSGYAWSSNAGWISFNNSDLSSCSTTCQPKVSFSTGLFSGWAKILSTGDLIALSSGDGGGSGGTWGFKANFITGYVTGYAWGGNIIGWISSSCDTESPSSCSVSPYYTKVKPLSPPTVTLTASPTSVASGGTPLLTWTASSDATSCTAGPVDFLDIFNMYSDNSSKESIPITSNTTYTYTCTGPGGTSSATATVTVLTTPPTVTISASPTVVADGGSSTLTWKTANNPTSCTASGGWGGSRAASGGSVVITGIDTANTYTITCSNSGGSASSSVSINLSPTVTISASPSTVNYGKTSTLTWLSTNVTSTCTASGAWSGYVESNDTGPTSALTAPSNTFTITCSNAYGSASASTTVTVISPPTGTLTASDCSISAGNSTCSTSLLWSTTNPTGDSAVMTFPNITVATGNSGSKAYSVKYGTKDFYLYNFGYLLATATAKASCDSVSVWDGTKCVGAPTVTISASPSTVNYGKTSTLTWLSTNVTSTCTASGAWSGYVESNDTGPTSALTAPSNTFTITCSNAYGSASASTTVTVISPPTGTLTASNCSISAGQSNCSSLIDWTTTNPIGTSSVTTPTNITVATANSSADTTAIDSYTVDYGSRNFYLYNDGYLLATATATASCNMYSMWNGTKCVSNILPTASITANPANVLKGGTSVITWSSTDATSCTISGPSLSSSATSGTYTTGALTMVGTPYTYSISCGGPGGSASNSATVYAYNTPTLTLKANPTTVSKLGDTSYLTWTSTNATSCSATGAWSGIRGLTNNSDSKNQAGKGVPEIINSISAFMLTCSNPAALISSSVIVGIPTLPTVSLSADPTTVPYGGGPSTLTWSSVGASSCTAGGGWSGAKDISAGTHTQSVSLTTADQTYTLKCSNSSGPTTASVTVTIGPKPLKPIFKEL